LDLRDLRELFSKRRVGHQSLKLVDITTLNEFLLSGLRGLCVVKKVFELPILRQDEVFDQVFPPDDA
jgi:hypothetical protein